jgi:hypothetical protein
MKHPDDLLEVERRCFAETSNAMHAWAAYRLARVCDAPVPEWVLRYLDLVGRNLLHLSAAHDSDGKDLGQKIADAAMLKGKPRAGSPLVNYHADWMVFGMNVRDRMTRIGRDGRSDLETYAIESVALESQASKSTVRRAYKLYNALFPGDAIFPDETIER